MPIIHPRFADDEGQLAPQQPLPGCKHQLRREISDARASLAAALRAHQLDQIRESIRREFPQVFAEQELSPLSKDKPSVAQERAEGNVRGMLSIAN